MALLHLLYLYTHDIEPEYTHVVVLGDRGYWQSAAHRLAQPAHILALPHTPSENYIDPAKHDDHLGILPNDDRSAYMHSRDFQARLHELETDTIDMLEQKGKRVLIVNKAQVKNITRCTVKKSSFKIVISNVHSDIFANKIVIASGAGPSRSLSSELQACLSPAASAAHTDGALVVDLKNHILDYTDILTSQTPKCRNKDVIIYGGGATSAWAMEIAASTAKPKAWVAHNGFHNALTSGPRVNAIVQRSKEIQIHGKINTIAREICSHSGEAKLAVKISSSTGASTSEKTYLVDYLINCIGQEPYEIGGLPFILSEEIKSELTPCEDKNNLAGAEEKSMLAWETKNGDLVIIGAAYGTYYDRERAISRPPAISRFLPRSAQVPSTIGGVVSSVCAYTNYMPISQDPSTGKGSLTSLNIHVMNATQLAVYFTASYPGATASDINNAVAEFTDRRSKTEFGVCEQSLSVLLQKYFSHLASDAVCEVSSPRPRR